MDHEQQSASYPRSTSQYYDNDYRNTGQAPLTDRRQPFSTRAGRGPADPLDAVDSGYTRVQPADSRGPRGSNGHAVSSKPPRQPLAALHVPSPHAGQARRDSHRNALSPISPLSPLDGGSPNIQRRGSVPHRSPLQKLEGKLDDISKEEKRARLEEAEHRAMRRMERDSAKANQSRRVDNQLPSRNMQTSGPARVVVPSSAMNHTDTGRRHSSAPQTTQEFNAQYAGRRSNDFESDAPKPTAGRLYSPRESQAKNAGPKPRRASDASRMPDEDQMKSVKAMGISEPRDPQSRPSGDYTREMERQGSKRYSHRARDAGFAGAAAASSTFHPGFDPSIGRDSSNVRDNRNIPSARAESSSLPAVSQSDSRKLQKKPVPQAQTYDQTASRWDGRDRQASANPQNTPQPRSGHQHAFSGLFHGHHDQARVYEQGHVFEEWRVAETAKLTQQDMTIDTAAINSARRRSNSRGGARSGSYGTYDGASDEEETSFRPPLFLKCGPLLRYTGMRREKMTNENRPAAADREIWRGSVMIVTLDDQSTYDRVPVLRIFAQPMDLLPPPPSDLDSTNQDLPTEFDDPIAGQTKVSRTGRTLFVKPVDELEGGVDVSRVEDNSGLFESIPSQSNVPPQMHGDEGQPSQQHFIGRTRSRLRRPDGEQAGKYREIRASRLHAESGVTFWRFNIEIELGRTQTRVAYRINKGPAIGFWVPARGESMTVMFHSCNGFSLSVNPDTFSGPDPLWRDVLNKHQSKPFHVMLGGGDQIYNDAATRDTELFKAWTDMKNPEHKRKADFSQAMQHELENFYLDRYSMWFSQGLFGLANCQIPMVNVWDDHDIIDGYGSYPHHSMSTKVFTGLGAVAFKYYMLFQHQSVVSETQREEPSWLLGASPGPYIHQHSRSLFMFLGRKVAFLGLDCRTERMRDEILCQESYDIIFDRCRREIIKGDTKHLIVLLGVPIAYPRLNFLENILTSRIMDPVKAIGRTGVLGGFVNKFDGGVEILDDLDDHWTAKHHKAERNWFVQELQELAAEKSVRITILGGDVHLGAVGQFYTKKKLGVAKDLDHRYMPNVISSAIVNTPPPNLMSDILNKRNKIHHLDAETDEDMIPMFEEDVDFRPRNNVHLLPRRNYCTISEYVPGSTPPPSPQLDGQGPDSMWPQRQDSNPVEQRFPPGPMKRTLSLGSGTFRPGNLVRRLSGSRSRAPDPLPFPNRAPPSYETHASTNMDHRPAGQHGSYVPSAPVETSGVRPTFQRRPTDLSEKRARKAAARGGPEGNIDSHESGHIDLEGGLDIALNMEIDQRDPAGTTRAYRLLVPALWYEGHGDPNTARFKSRRASIMDHLRGRVGRHHSEDDYSDSEGSRSASEERNSMDRSTDGRINNHQDAPIAVRNQHNTNGPNNVPVYNKEMMPQPTRRHPALPPNKEYNAPGPLPSASHPSQLHQPEAHRKKGRISAGLFGFRRNNQPTENYDDSDTEGSFTESDLESIDLAQQARQRRPSKTDRFFGADHNRGGINNDMESRVNNNPYSQQQVGPNGLPQEGKGKGWKIWK